MSRADELRRFTADAAGYYYRDGGPIVLFSDASTIIRELESRVEELTRDTWQLGTARDEIEAEIARMRPVVEAAHVLWNSSPVDFVSEATSVCRAVLEYEAAKKGGQDG